jgi:hypothetical protein
MGTAAPLKVGHKMALQQHASPSGCILMLIIGFQTTIFS